MRDPTRRGRIFCHLQVSKTQATKDIVLRRELVHPRHWPLVTTFGLRTSHFHDMPILGELKWGMRRGRWDKQES